MLRSSGGWTLSELLIGLLLSSVLSVAVGRFFVDLLGQDLRLLRQRELAHTLSWLMDRLEQVIRHSARWQSAPVSLLADEFCLLTLQITAEGSSWRGYRFHADRQTVLVRGWNQAPNVTTACAEGQGWQPLLPEHVQIIHWQLQPRSEHPGLMQIALRASDRRDPALHWQGHRLVWWRQYAEFRE